MGWLDSFFSKTEVRTLPIAFSLDVTEEDEHRITVGFQINQAQYPVDSLDRFLAYGFALDQGGIRWSLSEDDRQKLASLKASGAFHEGQGVYSTPILPPVLQYLRQHQNVHETDKSRELEVLRKPPEQTVSVDFDVDEGMTVERVLALEGGAMVLEEDAKITPDGGYWRIGKTFAPVSEKSSKLIDSILPHYKSRIPLADVPEFFQRDLVMLRTNFKAILSEEAARIQILDEEFHPLIKVSHNGEGWLEFDLSYRVGNYELPADLIRSARDQYVTFDPYTFIRKDEKTIQKTERELEELKPVITEAGMRVPVERFASLDEFINRIGGSAELNAAYQEFLDQLTGFEASMEYQLPEAIEDRIADKGFILRPYQRAGIHWLNWLKDHHLHGVLADDMGLGKTLQSLIVLRQAYEETESDLHSLILCPRAVLRHWSRELQKVYPGIRNIEYSGSARRSSLLKQRGPVVFISTYTTMMYDIEPISQIPFFYLILDEATKIKNPATRRSKAVKRINAAHRLTLTGTPVENRPQELWSQFDFLMKGHLGRYGTFERLFANPILAGDVQASTELGKKIKPFVMRRTKEEVAQDLPGKLELDEWCSLTDEQADLYSKMLEEYAPVIRDELQEGKHVSRISILPLLMRLKQLCDHPSIITGEVEPVLGRSEKFDLAVDRIQDIRHQGEQVVLFSHFLSMLDLFEIELSRRNISYIRLDGSSSNNQRDFLIEQFNKKTKTAALCSLTSMGYGVNLQTANHVIHVDRWWNPAVEDQATDRVHRIGQDKQVYVYRMIVQGTLEEKIDQLQDRKREIAGDIIGAATTDGLRWTREELLEILKPLER